MCRSAQNDVRSAQTNLTLDLTLVPALRGVRGWHEVGRGNPVMHDIADEFTCTSENNPSRMYVRSIVAGVHRGCWRRDNIQM